VGPRLPIQDWPGTDSHLAPAVDRPVRRPVDHPFAAGSDALFANRTSRFLRQAGPDRAAEADALFASPHFLIRTNPGKDRSKRFLVLDSDHPLACDIDPLEEHFIQTSTAMLCSLYIRDVAVIK